MLPICSTAGGTAAMMMMASTAAIDQPKRCPSTVMSTDCTSMRSRLAATVEMTAAAANPTGACGVVGSASAAAGIAPAVRITIVVAAASVMTASPAPSNGVEAKRSTAPMPNALTDMTMTDAHANRVSAIQIAMAASTNRGTVANQTVIDDCDCDCVEWQRNAVSTTQAP